MKFRSYSVKLMGRLLVTLWLLLPLLSVKIPILRMLWGIWPLPFYSYSDLDRYNCLLINFYSIKIQENLLAVVLRESLLAHIRIHTLISAINFGQREIPRIWKNVPYYFKKLGTYLGIQPSCHSPQAYVSLSRAYTCQMGLRMITRRMIIICVFLQIKITLRLALL